MLHIAQFLRDVVRLAEEADDDGEDFDHDHDFDYEQDLVVENPGRGHFRG